MTLEKHQLDGIPAITAKTLPASDFDELLLAAGYIKIGTAPAKGNRIKYGGIIRIFDVLRRFTVLMERLQSLLIM